MRAHYAAHGKKTTKKHGQPQDVGGNASAKPSAPRVIIEAVPEHSFGERLAARLALWWAEWHPLGIDKNEGISNQQSLEGDL